MIKKVFIFCENTLNFIRFLFELCQKKNFSNPIKKIHSGTIAILANGPSLKEDVLPYIENNSIFKNVDLAVMNFFALNELFFKIKPKHYFFADTAFFYESCACGQEERILTLFTAMQDKVDWKLTVYVPKEHYYDFLKYSKITNEHINVVRMNLVTYRGYNRLRHFFFAKGLATPYMCNVLPFTIYTCINSGYSKIMLYGADHTFFDICVNENNQLCWKYSNFYDKQSSSLVPITTQYVESYKMSSFLHEMHIVFKAHDTMANYANSLNVEIVNCTRNSFIDSYKRASLLDKIEHTDLEALDRSNQ